MLLLGNQNLLMKFSNVTSTIKVNERPTVLKKGQNRKDGNIGNVEIVRCYQIQSMDKPNLVNTK